MRSGNSLSLSFCHNRTACLQSGNSLFVSFCRNCTASFLRPDLQRYHLCAIGVFICLSLRHRFPSSLSIRHVVKMEEEPWTTEQGLIIVRRLTRSLCERVKELSARDDPMLLQEADETLEQILWTLTDGIKHADECAQKYFSKWNELKDLIKDLKVRHSPYPRGVQSTDTKNSSHHVSTNTTRSSTAWFRESTALTRSSRSSRSSRSLIRLLS